MRLSGYAFFEVENMEASLGPVGLVDDAISHSSILALVSQFDTVG
jgi:hypothetical protein